MPDTSIRYISMLSLIPARPRKITARELHDKLAAQGFDIDVRSVERDLHKLSKSFPVTSDEERPAGWFWPDRDAHFKFPRMDAATALTYELLSRYLKPILPREMNRHLEPEFSAARRVLNELGSSPLGKWSRRVAVLPQGQQLLPPEIDNGVNEVVNDALLNGKRFRADYRKLDADKPRQYAFNPQAIVYRQGVIYLVANVWEYDEPLQFALHRMSNAQLLDEPARALKDFDLQRYIHENKEFDQPTGERIRLELLVEAWLARHLSECRLADDQSIAQTRDGNLFKVVATVDETEQLRWWLRSFGPDVEVLKPAHLRRRMAKDANAAATLYR